MQEDSNEKAVSSGGGPEGRHEKPAQAEAQMAADGEKRVAAAAPPPPPTRSRSSSSAASSNSGQDGPPGGYDSTPLPQANLPTYTIKITIHRATNLPMADVNSLSSDPYVEAELDTQLPRRHREDPLIKTRTETVRKNTDPEWNTEWIVAGVPGSGFTLKFRVVDEDPTDSDDRLGNAHVHVKGIDDRWEGIRDQAFKINKRSGSKRAYLVRSCAACFDGGKAMHGSLHISVQLLGRTQDIGQGARAYTVGPSYWIRHYSPMLGRLTNRKEPDTETQHGGLVKSKPPQKKSPERYNFQANQFQLRGPVPSQLYHRFVEFKPWVARMFNLSGLRGYALGKALHHQHNRVYHFDRETRWGHFPSGPSRSMTQAFLELVRHDQGGRIFTFVLTLDACLRFTETGPEFGVDMLSKHNMHSDKALYLAWAGEFFIRRLAHPDRPEPPEPTIQTSQSQPQPPATASETEKENPTHPPSHLPHGPPDSPPPKDPEYYELVIDNDSGTYRPNASLLPMLKTFLSQSLPGLHILTLDCVADADLMAKMKTEQRERKAEEGSGQVVFMQGPGSDSDDTSSVSSSDEEDLDAVEARLHDSPGGGSAFGPGRGQAGLGDKLAEVEEEGQVGQGC
ncbi:hypothetical protein MBLNU230_g1029t1 [Neophaeotheca triangularis]